MNLFPLPGLVTAVLCVALVSIVWTCVVAAIGYFGGWHKLAQSFRAEQTTFRIDTPTNKKRFRCASMSLGPKHFPVNYGNCLTIHVSDEGISIRIWPMFRPMHPPLLVRWPDIERCEREVYFLNFTRTAVYLKRVRHPLRFHGAAGREIFAALSQRPESASSGRAAV
jgi:hypothetical protein